jgi:hypothetical protein
MQLGFCVRNRFKFDPHFQTIKRMIEDGKTNLEIASFLNCSNESLSVFVRKKFGGNPNFLNSIKKHSHLHEEVLKLRLRHDDEFIMDKLNLTSRELKSCLTAAYKKPSLAHLRKDKRKRDPWSNYELKYLLKNAGLISRKKINDHLKRGKSDRVIKEKLNSLGISSKNLNGLTLTQFKNLFKKDPDNFIQTSAGPPNAFQRAGENGGRFKIVTWIEISKMIKEKKIDAPYAFKKYIDAMTLFQNWVNRARPRK